MNPAFRFAAFAILTFATIVAGAGVMGTTRAHASPGTSLNCEVPLQVICKVGHADGIRQVIFTGDTALGPIEWVNETYTDCPTEVVVVLGGDHVLSAGPMSLQVVLCDSGLGDDRFDFKAAPRAGDDTREPAIAKTVPSAPGVALIAQEGTQVLYTINILDPCYVHFPNCNLASYECMHLGVGCPPPRSPWD